MSEKKHADPDEAAKKENEELQPGRPIDPEHGLGGKVALEELKKIQDKEKEAANKKSHK